MAAAVNGDVSTLTAGVPLGANSWKLSILSDGLPQESNVTATMTVNNRDVSMLLCTAGADWSKLNEFIRKLFWLVLQLISPRTEVTGILRSLTAVAWVQQRQWRFLPKPCAQPVDADPIYLYRWSANLTGILVRTGVDTLQYPTHRRYSQRDHRINGDGVVGNPMISILTAVTFTPKTATQMARPPVQTPRCQEATKTAMGEQANVSVPVTKALRAQVAPL
ncbi:MAG: hypothetical protein IPI29_08595 [Ignavibacteria bacterium]|nr:hypothetical protein [Ignavibacteria bacterium]